MLAAVALTLGSRAADAAPILNEIMINAPNGGDDGREWFEIRSTTDGVESLNGYHLVVLHGYFEAPPGTRTPGEVRLFIDLAGLSTGTNGLLLVQDVSPVSLTPTPSAQTTTAVRTFPNNFSNSETFTYLLVQGFNETTGAVGTDLDTDNDGTLDLTPWTSVADAVSIWGLGQFANFTGVTHAAGLGFPLGESSPFADSTPDTAIRMHGTDEWLFVDVTGVGGGPYAFDPDEFFSTNGTTYDSIAVDQRFSSPGNMNPVPEPATWAMLAVGGLVAGLRMIRRRAAA